MARDLDLKQPKGMKIHPDPTSLARAAADHFVSLAEEAIAARGRFAVVLSGGSTPRASYALLATDGRAARVDWLRVHIFWGDERCVPPDHPDSNFRMAREALLDHVPIPAGNVHRVRGELDPAQAAAEYQQALQKFFATASGDTPSFDLVLLGMGGDGHTASLFPGTAAVEEQSRWVVAHFVDKLEAWRITLTPAIINTAANVTFIVSGQDKAERLLQVLEGPYQPHVLPAQVIRPGRDRLQWLVDAPAAALLQGG
jgi:6-phosphogluconolactonase